MRTIDIRKKLEEIDFSLDEIKLGDFDYIGEFAAKKNRDQNHPLYKSAGCFFRPNYERGILIYSLIKQFRIKSFLEIGFGRGYSAFCAAKAMTDLGIEGKIVTVDSDFNQDFLKHLTTVFPKRWFDLIEFHSGRSEDVVPSLEGQFDLIYIDGDHTYEGVKKDWENTKDRFNKFLLFDDYIPKEVSSKGEIQCSQLIDEIENESKELITMDRRIFFDDRRIPDSEIKYGQVLLTNQDFDTSDYILDW